MQANVRLEPGTDPERRYVDRHCSATAATVRQQKGRQEDVRLVNISSDGCGFVSRWLFPVGARVWLSLPGIETWAATVVWFVDGRGGLRFERQLHPMVVQRYVSQASSEDFASACASQRREDDLATEAATIRTRIQAIRANT